MTLETDRQDTANTETRDLMPVGLLDPQQRAALFSDPYPALLLAADGRTPLWSSHEAARRFGYRDAMSLMRGRLPETAPGTRRLAELGVAADFSTPLRLERLRYFVGFRGIAITALCRALPLGDGRTGLLLSFPPPEALEGDALAEALAARRSQTATAARQGEEQTGENSGFASGVEGDAIIQSSSASTPAQAQPAAADIFRSARIALGLEPTGRPESDAASANGSDSARDEDDAAQTDERVAALNSKPFQPLPPFEALWLRHSPETLQSKRFIFTLDHQGRVQSITPPLADAVGPANAPQIGQSLSESIRTFDDDAAARIDAALDAGETWAGLRLEWPVSDTDVTVPVELSALPLVDQQQGITGYSGFGRCRLAEANRAGRSAFAPDVIPAINDSAQADDPDLFGEATGSGSAYADANETADDPAPGALDQAAWASASFPDMPGGTATESDDAPLAPFPDQPDLWQAFAASLPDADQDESAANDILAVASADDTATPTDENSSHHETTQPESDDAPVEPPIAPDRNAPSPVEITPFPLPGGRRKADPPGDSKVVSIHNGQPTHAMPGFQRQGLSMTEKNAFREIAKALGARFDEDGHDAGRTSPADTGLTGNTADHPDRQSELARLAGIREPRPPVAEEPVAALAAASGVEFTDFLDRLPLGMLVLKDDEPLFANRTLLDLAAYPDFATFTREQGARAIFRKGIAPRADAASDPVVLATRDGEMVPVDAHLQLIDWDGTKATLISFRRAVELEQGKALRTVALDLKRARNEAQELRAILDTATDGVITLDDKGHILSLNGAAEALFGIRQNEIVGEHMTRLFANESHAIAMDYLDGMKSGGVRSVLNDGREVLGREKNGGTMPLFMTLGRISEETPPRFCAVLRDITAWKRAEFDLTEARQSAERASAKKSDFLAKISHEIRTPMNAIMGFAEVMQEERLGPVGTPKYKEYLADIRTSGQHVVSLVNDLLDLAKIEAGRMELNFQATDINGIVASTVAIMQPQANSARVLVRSQLAAKLPPVVADERSIRQIVLNILSNATRFTEAGGQVIVSTSLLEGGEAVIRIRDTGIGMSTAEIDQALEPFRQVGRKRDKGGTGLGLPLTKALVEANRANFAIRSRPGEGTLVEVTFPATRVLAE